MSDAKRFYILDKVKNKYICQVEENGIKCLRELSNTGNTSGRRDHILNRHKILFDF